MTPGIPWGIIFRRTLRDSRVGIVGWGLALAAMGFMVIALFPSIDGMLSQFGELLENPVVKMLVGDVKQFATMEGFLGVKLFSMLPLILAVYAVLFALGIVAGEEARGTLDILLSTPAPRWQIVVEKVAALVVALLIILAMMLAGMLAGGLTIPDFSLSVGQLAAAVINALPVTLLMAALALLLSTVLRHRGTAGGVATAIIVGAYFLTTLTDMAGDSLKALSYLSFYEYYNGAEVLIDGIYWPGFIGLLVAAGALFALSVVFFQRRDVLSN